MRTSLRWVQSANNTTERERELDGRRVCSSCTITHQALICFCFAKIVAARVCDTPVPCHINSNHFIYRTFDVVTIHRAHHIACSSLNLYTHRPASLKARKKKGTRRTSTHPILTALQVRGSPALSFSSGSIIPRSDAIWRLGSDMMG